MKETRKSTPPATFQKNLTKTVISPLIILQTMRQKIEEWGEAKLVAHVEVIQSHNL